jgi:hypothetical protein
MSRRDEDPRDQPPDRRRDLESPFLEAELFIHEDAGRAAHLASLEVQSPFRTGPATGSEPTRERDLHEPQVAAEHVQPWLEDLSGRLFDSEAGEPAAEEFTSSVLLQMLRYTVRAAAEAERLAWRAADGTLRYEGAQEQFGRLVRYWLASRATIRPDTLSHLQRRAIEVAYDAALQQANPSDRALTNAARRARDALLAGAPGRQAPPGLVALVETAVRNARRSARDVEGAAWSAVFVVSCVRTAAIWLARERVSADAHTGQNALLQATDRHLDYVREARARRARSDTAATYLAFEPAARPLVVSDIIVQDRRPGIRQPFSLQALPERERTHGDIVVEVDRRQRFAVTLGGNLSDPNDPTARPSRDGVRRRRFPLDENGTLVVRADTLFEQERNDGTLPAVPAPIARRATDALHTRSTGRIFALLSLAAPTEVAAEASEEAPDEAGEWSADDETWRGAGETAVAGPRGSRPDVGDADGDDGGDGGGVVLGDEYEIPPEMREDEIAYRADEAGHEDEASPSSDAAAYDDEAAYPPGDAADDEGAAYPRDDAPYGEEAAYPPDDAPYDEEAYRPVDVGYDEEAIEESFIGSASLARILGSGAVQRAQQLIGAGAFQFALLRRFASGEIWNEDYLALEILLHREPRLRPTGAEPTSTAKRLARLYTLAVKHQKALTPIRDRLVRPVFGIAGNFVVGSAAQCEIRDVRTSVANLGPLPGGKNARGETWYKRDARASPRKRSAIDSIVLHHMAFNRGNDLADYLKVGAHYAVTADGQIAQLYDDLDFLNASNGFNGRSIAIEFAGNFPDHRFRWWKPAKRTLPDRCYLTPAQVRAGRCLLATLKARFSGIEYVYAHRQSSANKANDPGPDVWYHVGEWAIRELRLTDRAPRTHVGTGQPIPTAWRTARTSP